MDNNDPLEEISNHLKEVKRYDIIEENLINTKTSIEEDSDDYKFFITAIGGSIECCNAIAEKAVNKKPFNNTDVGYFEDLCGLLSMMIDHVFDRDKSKYSVIRSYDEEHKKK